MDCEVQDLLDQNDLDADGCDGDIVTTGLFYDNISGST